MRKGTYSIILTILSLPILGIFFFAFTAFGEETEVVSSPSVEVETRSMDETSVRPNHDEELKEKMIERRETIKENMTGKKEEMIEKKKEEVKSESSGGGSGSKYKFIKKYSNEDQKERYKEEIEKKQSIKKEIIKEKVKENTPSNNNTLIEEDEASFEVHNKSVDTKLKENVSTISTTIKNLDREGKETKERVKDEIEKTVKEEIKERRDKVTNIKPQTKEEVANIARNLNENIEKTLKYRDIVDKDKLEELKNQIDEVFAEIEKKVEAESGKDIDLTERKEKIKARLDDLNNKIDSKKKIIEERGGELLFKDSDGDGLSDYDEEHIYKTDPNSAFTKGGKLNDREKIVLGINPTSEVEEKIKFENPKEDKTSIISDLHSVTEVKLKKEADKEELELKGKALPNSLVTLYIFSTPIVVTVQADESGEWTYSLTKELENGDHEVYVATVDNTGKIVARSNPIPFVKTAEAATINLLGNEVQLVDEEGSFLSKNLISIIATILGIAFIVLLIILGRRTNLHEELNEIK